MLAYAACAAAKTHSRQMHQRPSRKPAAPATPHCRRSTFRWIQPTGQGANHSARPAGLHLMHAEWLHMLLYVKDCSECQRTMPAAAFSLNRGTCYDLNARCKKCVSARTMAQQQLRGSPQAPVPEKLQCARCRLEKPIFEFTPMKAALFGVTTQCRQCFTKKGRKHVQLLKTSRVPPAPLAAGPHRSRVPQCIMKLQLAGKSSARCCVALKCGCSAFCDHVCPHHVIPSTNVSLPEQPFQDSMSGYIFERTVQQLELHTVLCSSPGVSCIAFRGCRLLTAVEKM